MLKFNRKQYEEYEVYCKRDIDNIEIGYNIGVTSVLDSHVPANMAMFTIVHFQNELEAARASEAKMKAKLDYMASVYRKSGLWNAEIEKLIYAQV